ncbi:MAG: TonB-dependent receptor [Puniceicoccaceae bacterium 5H]|nr:MAG: TonB-dependent receptor [Puniceicoccaceae bacterium 5H]
MKLTRLLLSAGLIGSTTIAAWGQNAAREDDTPVFQLPDLEVQGDFRRSWLESMREQAESTNYLEVVNANDVGKLPDSNIAEALQRLPGLYLQSDQGEGRYVSIRGVDPILNNVTLNGQTIAVSDTDGRSGRAAPLDVLGSNSLSQIEVIKVVTPDMDGQAIGGTINIRTPSAFDHDGYFTYGSFEWGYNDQAPDAEIYSGEANAGFRFGPDETWGLYVGTSYSYREYVSYLAEARDWFTLDDYVAADGTANAYGEVRLPERSKLGSADGERERYGVNANLEFRPQYGSLYYLRAYYTRYTDFEFRPEYTFRMRNIDADDARVTSATSGYVTRAEAGTEVRYEKQIRPVSQIVLGGEQELADGLKLEASGNYTKAEEKNPVLNYYESSMEADTRSSTGGAADAANAVMSWDVSGFFPVFTPLSGNDADGNARWPGGDARYDEPDFNQITRIRYITSQVQEETWTGKADLTWDGFIAERPTTLKTGFKYLTRDKSVNDDDNRYNWEGDPAYYSQSIGNYGTLGIPHASYNHLDHHPFGPAAYDSLPGYIANIPAQNAHFNQYRDQYEYDESGSLSNSVEDDYSLTEEILAVYAMGTYDLTSRLRLLGGARMEWTDVDIKAYMYNDTTGTVSEEQGTNAFDNFLPNLQLYYKVTDQVLLRAALSSTIGRPDYPDMAPISTLEYDDEASNQLGTDYYEEGSLEIGNPDLDPYESLNFDGSASYFFQDGSGNVSVAVFRKDIDNAIYAFEEDRLDQTINGIRFNTVEVQTFNNADDGEINGLELTYQQDFEQLIPALKGFGTLLNATWIDSSVKVFQRPGEELPFFNQPDRLFNAQVYYEDHGFSLRVAYSYQDAALLEVGGSTDEDIYIASRTTWSAKASYDFTENFSVYVSGENLSDEPYQTYQGNEQYLAENPGYEVYGRTYRVGVNWNY